MRKSAPKMIQAGASLWWRKAATKWLCRPDGRIV
jgi:hypothetical protein